MALLFPAAEREVLPLPFSFVSFSFHFFSVFLPLWFVLSFPFSLFSPLFGSFLFFFFSLSSLCSLSFSFFSLRFFSFSSPLPFAAVLGAIYRASERGFLLWCMGSRSRGGWLTIGRDCQGVAPPVFWQGARRVVGQWAWLVRRGSLGFGKACGQERGRKLKEEKKNTPIISSPAAHPGDEERGTVSFKTTPFRSSSSSSSSFKHETTSFWTKRVVSFK